MIKNKQDIEQLLENKWRIKGDSYFDSDFYTKTHFFLMPLLNNKLVNNVHFPKHYINSYLNDEEKNTFLNNIILIHFRTTDISEQESHTWNILYNQIINMDNECCYYYYVGNNKIKNEIIFAFRIDNDFISDYQLLLNNKYSQTSDFYKKRILDFHKNNGASYPILKGILFKEDWLKKKIEFVINQTIPSTNEYWDNFVSQREFFRYDYKPKLENENTTG